MAVFVSLIPTMTSPLLVAGVPEAAAKDSLGLVNTGDLLVAPRWHQELKEIGVWYLR